MKFFSVFQRKLPVDTTKIEQAISHLEQLTSAEVRVVVEYQAKKSLSAIARAEQLFDELEMYKTAERNAVLLYLSFKPHYVAVVGDEGIHAKVGPAFWEDIYTAMKVQCQNGCYTEAICQAITQLEQPLGKNFPAKDDDVNEIPNEVIIK